MTCGSVVAGLTAVVAATVIAVGRTDGPAPAPVRTPTLSSAGVFLVGELREKLDGRWSRAWSSLYPLHQRIAVKPVYVRCERATPFLSRTLTFGVLRIRRSRVHVPGLAQSLPGAAVTLRVRIAWYGPRDPIVLTPTLHVVAVGGHWRWLLSRSSYRMYRRAACGSLPPV
jgi:hypothetical protein